MSSLGIHPKLESPILLGSCVPSIERSKIDALFSTIYLLISHVVPSQLHSVGFQVEHAALIGRLLNQMALCQLPSHVSLPPEIQSRSRASTRTGRVKTPVSGRERAEETGSQNVGAILDDALKHMKLAQQYPGECLL